MFKTLFISLNLIGLISLPFLYVGNVSVQHSTPNEITENSETEITITINKGSVTGPARLVLNLDNASGLRIEEISNGGASFSFDNSSALFVWYSIPEEETVTLTYKLIANSGSMGTKTISGSFSYLDGEERNTAEISPITFQVTEGNGNSSTTSVIPETNTSQSTPISGVRTITKNGDDYIVEVVITKGDQTGFARLKENIPVEFTANKIDASGGVYKFTNNTVKFLWTKIPSDSRSVTVSYRLTPISQAPREFTISGYFSGEFLIVNDKPQSIDIPATTFVNDDLAVNNGGNENGNDTNEGNGNDGSNDVNDNNENDNSNNGNNTSDGNGNNNGNDSGNDNGSDTSNNNDNNNSNSNDNGNDGSNDGSTTVQTNSNPVTGVSFRVQVLAAHKTVDARYIKKRYNGYNKQLNLENHQGWVKYTTDGVSTYKSARNNRNGLSKYDFPGPFVTAYNSGERITVQEALMLTSQKWVQ